MLRLLRSNMNIFSFHPYLFHRVSPKTVLTFCTNGVLLRTLMSGERSLSTVTHVIVVSVLRYFIKSLLLLEKRWSRYEYHAIAIIIRQLIVLKNVENTSLITTILHVMACVHVGVSVGMTQKAQMWPNTTKGTEILSTFHLPDDLTSFPMIPNS